MSATQTDSVTLADLAPQLERHGLTINDIQRIEVAPEMRGDLAAPLVLVAHRFLYDGDGHRYAVRVDGQPIVATEPVQLRLAALLVA